MMHYGSLACNIALLLLIQKGMADYVYFAARRAAAIAAAI
jgi:hypothetical protein